MPDTEARTRESMRGTLLPLPISASPSCANCGTSLTGPYCSNCGQHVADFHRSVWRFVADFFDNTICWDNKLLLTLGPLFKQPGKLTHDFMAGRRARYVHPLRLFLFTSAVCLAILQYTHDNSPIHVDAERGAAAKAKHGLHVNFTRPGSPEPTPSALPTPASPEEDQPATGPAKAETVDNTDHGAGHVRKDDADALGDSIRTMVAKEIAVKSEEGKENADDLGEKIDRMAREKIANAGGAERFSRMMTQNFQQKLSWVALAILPVFACGMRGVYWRKDSYYFAHLIFSLHYHTFLFLFWTGYTGLVACVAFLPLHSLWEGLARLCLLWPPVYLYLGLRRLYVDSKKRTVVKVCLLSTMHLVAILAGVAMVGALTFFTTGN